MSRYYSISEEREAVPLPIWTEALIGIEWLYLRSSPVYWGFGVPHGHGDAVIMIPGFMGSDLYLREMHGWLKRIGYRPFFSGIGVNADCPNILMGKLDKTIDRAWQETARPVHLVGHSLGGMLARSAAARNPFRVASVISLGSPFRGVRAHPAVIQISDLVRDKVQRDRPHLTLPDCFTGYCGCDFVEGLRGLFPSSVRQTAIYTKSDGIVHWETCMTGDGEIDVEVLGTHSGLAFNPFVYQVIAGRLAKR
ncbi:MAG: alpha/beta fold hydrolase [Bryobacteraceae bacterium]|nr:alpha/beta fold hydrolase [Bryobacteraceae bacterium]